MNSEGVLKENPYLTYPVPHYANMQIRANILLASGSEEHEILPFGNIQE